MKYPAMENVRRSGNEQIIDTNGSQISLLSDFWSWAYSDLMSNTERGALAEYLVSCALNIQDEKRITWRKFDLLSKEGIKIEVKSSGYLQTWGQEKLSNIIFGIQETHGWNEIDDTYETQKKRQSDVYVFCVHKHTNQDTVNPLDVSQWDFYLISTKRLNAEAKSQKSISLSSLLKIGAVECCFDSLGEAIKKIIST